MTAMNTEFEGSLVVLAKPGSIPARIQSRLLSSKILSVQVATSLEALKVLLNPTLKQNGAENNAQASSDKGVERLSKLRKAISMSTFQSTNLITKLPSRLDDADQDANDGAGWESGSIEEPDDGWESEDVGQNDAQEEDEEDASCQDSESEDDELKVKSKSKPLGNPAKSSSINESTFLPSLSVGFIRGGSDDSDWSETECKSTGLDPKKNRRGQRARRA